jgi:hypothetical protein
MLPDAFAPTLQGQGLQGQQRLFLAQFGGTRTLMLAWRLDLPAADGGALPETLVPLVDHVRAVRFAYYGAPDAWPDLLVSPVATISNECRYTGFDAGCHRTP